jgi:hypothetical protein
VKALLPGRISGSGNRLTRLLFGLRFGLGKIFGWDRPESAEEVARWSYRGRLSGALAARSVVSPGSADGFFRTLYVLDREALVETRNATVQAFLASVLAPRPDGYRLYWAVYIKPVSWLTPVYMAIIEPFRRFVVYPSLFRAVRRSWQKRYTA